MKYLFFALISLNSFAETRTFNLDITNYSQLDCDEYTYERPGNYRASIVITTENGIEYTSNDLDISQCFRDLMVLERQIPFKIETEAEITTSISRWANTTTKTEYTKFYYGGFQFHANKIISTYTDTNPDHNCHGPRC